MKKLYALALAAKRVTAESTLEEPIYPEVVLAGDVDEALAMGRTIAGTYFPHREGYFDHVVAAMAAYPRLVVEAAGDLEGAGAGRQA
jgi:hypothetical protein